MTAQRTIAWLLGGAAVGGAIVYGISQLATPPKSARGRSRRISDADVLLVRVTENGKKYHRDDCPLLHGETRVIPVSYALEHYEPCKACHPPGDLDMSEEEMAALGGDAT